MLSVNGVSKSYNKSGWFQKDKQRVLEDVSFQCGQGECLGIIGESGSGKSTLGRLILGIERPDTGEILFEGKRLGDAKIRAGNISAVFQDYTSSINPFFTVEQAIQEPLNNLKSGLKSHSDLIDDLLLQVGLHSDYRKKYPHELSGGETQRVCIARAISTSPKCIVLDEAISSLDGSVQLQILDLLKDLRSKINTAYIFITHDIQAAAYICDRIMIFRNGSIEEMVSTDQLKDVQSHYAKKLLQMTILN
ncbi:ABC transporter ATP-binding protein [Paenibacillus lemnae]|uniref:ABC transporter ATP-binding protein n=1 Tax=Paenibacillus lemnae TaxID=1330551 RepID=A0A848M9B6_PAELE|nr:ABC transporter ATP-binding protein [Paenibacillus lemnae]NMO97657.1 ABC transporter ATP-binding protein [Paenibacillus lemnae]